MNSKRLKSKSSMSLLAIFPTMSQVISASITFYIISRICFLVEFDCKQDELELWLMQEVEYRFFTIVEDNSEKEVRPSTQDIQ